MKGKSKKRSVLETRKYGHVELRIKEQMEKAGHCRNSLAVHCDTRFEVVDKWCNGKVERIDTDILAKLCFVLECKAGDLLVYVEDDPPENELK